MALPAPAWVPLSDKDLAHELVGAAIGPRSEGELSADGRYLIALWTTTDPILYSRHELYAREGEGWRISSSHHTRAYARGEVDRRRALAARRAARAYRDDHREPCTRCGGSGWDAGDDCQRCAGSGTRQAQP